MKTKFSFFITTLLCVFSSKTFAQPFLPYESTYPAPTVVSTGGFKTAFYDKCNGVLYVTMQTSHDNANIFPIYAAFVYIKIGSNWQNMMTIRGEDSKDANPGLQNCGAGITSGSGYTAVYNPPYDDIVSASTFTPCNFNAPPFRNNAEFVEAGHVKRRIGYYNGAFNQASWFSYEDEGICGTYATSTSDFIENKIEFTPYYAAPNNNVGDVSGIGANLLPICVYPSSLSGAWGLQFGIANIPQAAIVGNNVQIRVYVHYRNNDGEWDDASVANNKYETYQYSVAIQVPDAPVGLTASTNQCNQVTLNWSNASQTWSGALNCTNTQTYNNVIYRDGVKIAVVPGNATSYTDISGTPTPTNNVLGVGQTYQYTVKTILWNEGNKSFRSSANSNIATGSMKMPPQIATSFTASEDKCDSKIVLNWNQDPTNIDHFDLWYSTGGPMVLTTTLTSSARAYTFPATRGIITGFHLYSLNSCNYGPSGPAFVEGISPLDPAMATNVVATKNASNTAINVTWTDNANNETKYEIVRTDDIGNTILTQVNANQTSYTDAAAASCRVYNYKVRVYNGCVLSGITSTSQDTATLPPPNLNNTFDATKKLTASKGYFSNRVELSWSNNNGLNIDIFKIYRKQLGTLLDSVQIAAPNAGSGLYVDNTADARVFYRYTIVGVKSCNGVDLLTNISSDIGFRNPTGLVSGHIEYNGGIAVNGAKVFVQQSSATLAGNSLKFSPTGTLSIADGAKLEPGAQMRCEFWLKPTVAATGNILNKANAFSFGYNGSNWVAGIYTGGTQKTIAVPSTYTDAITVTTSSTTISTQTINPGYTTTTTVTSFTTVPNRTVTAVTTVSNVASNYTLTTVSTSITASVATFTTVNSNQWQHIALVYDGTNFKTFIDGKSRGTIAATGNVDDTNNDLIFGSATSDFYIDEFRLLGQSQADSIISIESNRILNGDETSFKCNLHFNESVGTKAYDVSKVGNFFNENHAAFTGPNVAWSSDIPTSSQLGYFGVTNALGNYIVSGIQYLGSGENFNLVPSYQTHSFSPNSRSVYIGDGTNVYNNQDFLDISSFLVTGTLFYKNTTCPVPDAVLKVDGLAVIADGQQIKTDANGTFSLQVPIGLHHIEIEKTKHDMVKGGRYPVTGKHNFQAPVSGIIFKDSTLRKVVGRVVGGDVQGDKIANLGKSKNNIGQAQLKIASPLTGSPCFTAAVITNSVTGEYEFNIPPLAYKFESVAVINNSVNISMATPGTLDYESNVFDIVNVNNTDTERDSIFVTLGTGSNKRDSLISVDTSAYHKRIDFIHYSIPEFNITNVKGQRFIGLDTLVVSTGTTTTKMSLVPTNSSNWGPFNFPVFQQKQKYTCNILAQQVYQNADNTALLDTVKLDGVVNVVNGLIDGVDPEPNVSLTKGIATYSFICGSPNTATSTPSYRSYTRDMKVNITPTGQQQYVLEPNATTTVSPSDNTYRAYIIGNKLDGTGFATLGPERVDMILRDPPGSESFSTWQSGTSIVSTERFSNAANVEANISAGLSAGTKGQIGFGVTTEIEVEASATTGLETKLVAGTGGEITETLKTLSTVSTRSTNDYVGDKGDIFIGRSRNWYFGPTVNIELVPVAQCSLAACFGPTIYPTASPADAKRLAKIAGLAVAPGEVSTRFSYTKQEIERNVIPTLEAIRKTHFTKPGSRYTTTVVATDSRFGSNNDDPLWMSARSTTTEAVYEDADKSGPSYTFNASTGTFTTVTLREPLTNAVIATYTYAIEVSDSVRIINNQIRMWKEALAQNEEEKYNCTQGIKATKIDNFSLGSAIVNNQYSSISENVKEKFIEFDLNDKREYEVKAKVNNNGGNLKGGLTVGYQRRDNSSTNTITENTFDYTLTDGNPGDLMSVDVYRPESGGNVFITRGGQTMCPYEDAVKCNYFDPANPNAWISSHTYNANGFHTLANATIKREVPDISVVGSNAQYNIPSGQPAIYQVQISNQSLLTINNSVPFRLYTPTESNPGGAFITVDGDAVNGLTSFSVAAGGSINKTVAIFRGPVDIEYDSLMVIMASQCSNKIADTIYLTAHFVPTCTDLNINTPVDNFIINNSNNNIQNVIFDGYNYNYGDATNTNTVTNLAHPNYGLEKIGFEIKPSNSSTWLQIQDFYKFPNAVGSNSLFPIPQGQVYTQYQWNVPPSSYADGNYEIRSVSKCYNKDGSYAVVYSPVHAGIMDRVNPAPFGTPSPADGILDPNDDISIQFNEPIDISSLNYAPISNPNSTFDIRGVLNGTAIRHSESLNFDGIADYAEVTGGASLQKRSFTFEFWAKFNSTGTEQTVISQGTDAIQKMSIGFDATNRLKFSLGSQIALSTNPVTLPTDWHHYAVVYDYPNADASLFVDGALAGTNNNFLVDYLGTGKLAFGKALPANNNFLNGNAHEIRLWSKARTISEITVTMNKVLSRNQSGLVYNWKMDEATGTVSADDIRSRNADIYGATWEVNPNGNAVQLASATNDNIQVSSGNIAINKEMDFTLEFWFNSTQPGVSTLFSNGEGVATTADSLNAWTIQKDAAGAIHVYHKGLDFVASTTNYFDGNWHHFALVMQRSANLSAYIDGNLQNSVQGINFNNLAGANMYLGAKAVIAGPTTTLSNYYDGKMDEFRLWSTARKTEQIKRDKQNRILGNEQGLLAYLPFESYTVVLGTPSLTPTFNNQSLNTLTITPQGAPSLIAQTPTIKLPRPIQSVNYTWSLNNDKIILSTNTSPDQLENVTLDITVQNALDMRGNKMQSPKTWIAYINKNQVKWQDDQFDFEKTVDSVITFVAPIVNSGGAQKAFTIGGLPSWMTSSATNGVIAPNSVQNITLTIPAGQAVGDYNAGVTVTTDFGYDEVLQINLKVKGVVPTWTVNAANYQYQMNIFGQLKIDVIIATNPESKIAAFCNGVVRGVANLQYVPAYDRYEAFLNIYSNTTFGDSIYFNIYDASTGVTFVTVDSSLTFMDNQVIGTIANPRTFSANSEISRSIVLNTGWTWVSFPLKTSKMNNSNSLLSTINPATGDIITGSVDYDQYDASLGWLGNISGNGGFKNNQSYKIKKATGETLLHIGARLNPDSTQATINVVSGWNWIGFISNKNLPIAEALGNYNAITGDIIKSQYEFAYYDNLTGWSGSLAIMKPTMGYMLKSSGTSTFNYPLLGFFGARTHQVETNHEPQTAYPFTPEQYSNTMSLIVKGNLCSEMLSQGNIVLGLFDNTNALRGYAHPTFANNSHKFYITAYSNTSAESLSLKYFNTSNGEIYATDTAVTFNIDAIIGTPSNPIRANLQDSLTCKFSDVTTSINESESIDMVVSPNPFEDNLSIQFHKELNAKVEVLDVLGKVIYASDVKNKRVVNLYFIKSNVPIAAGIYYIRVSGDVNKQIKVVKTK